jgi:hypothetical protein
MVLLMKRELAIYQEINKDYGILPNNHEYLKNKTDS